jgi:hypothetical protein
MKLYLGRICVALVQLKKPDLGRVCVVLYQLVLKRPPSHEDREQLMMKRLPSHEDREQLMWCALEKNVRQHSLF